MSTTESLSRLEAALVYAALKWPVIPLHTPTQLEDGTYICDCRDTYRKGELVRRGGADCKDAGKHPRTVNGLDDATTDELTIRRWWKTWPHANIAVDLARAGLVDVAPDSLEWWAEFTAQGLPPTLRFASGGGEGHTHYLYRRPDGCAVHRKCETGRYDVLSNGYAVMPPSLHKSGLLYTWAEPDGGYPISPPAEPAPTWVVGMLRPRQDTATAAASGAAVDKDLPPINLFGDDLERWHGRAFDSNPQTGKLDRSYSLWRLATILLAGGLQAGFVEDLIRERDAALGWDKFNGRNDATVRYRVIVARALASKGPKRIRLKSSPPKTSTRKTADWLTAEEIAAMEDESITWYAYGLLGGGLLSELDGKVKQAGKTTLVLAMVRAILEGAPFLGQATTYTPVVYLTEQSAPSFKRNLRRAGLLGRGDLHVLLWSRVLGWKWEHVVDAARAKAIETGARVLIVDTLGQFSGIRGDAENNSGTAMVVMEPLQAASAEGLAVLVSRHDRKSGGDVGDSGRGSSAYAGAVDVVLHLQRLPGNQPGKDRQRLIEGISRFEETPDKLLVELGPGEPHEYTALGDAQVLREQSLRTEVLANLPTNPDDAPTSTELKETIGVAAQELTRILYELVRGGIVLRIGIGRKGDPFRYYQRVYDDDDD